MKHTLLEYSSTDKFLLLFLTSDKLAQSPRSTITVHKDSFDPEVMEGFKDSLGIPDLISCTDYKVNLDEDYNLHGSISETEAGKQFSFVAIQLKLMWLDVSNTANDPIGFHRERGPASITLCNYKTYHHHGDRTGFSFNTSQYRWYSKGKQFRAAGPYLINTGMVSASVDSSGKIRSNNNIIDKVYWNHPSDNTNIISSDVHRALIEGGIKLNMMSLTESVFKDRLDEAAFYATV